MAGRIPKSAAHHRLMGTYRSDRHAGRAHGPPPGEPQRPADLAGDAAAFWDAAVPVLVAGRAVGAIDAPSLQATAEVWGLYRAALTKATEDPIDKAARCAVTSYLGLWLTLAAKLGLTPADRERLRLDLSERAAADPFDEFLDEHTPGTVPYRRGAAS